MLSVIPIPLVIEDVNTTGSAVVDLLGSLSIALYDLFSGAGLDLGGLSSVQL